MSCFSKCSEFRVINNFIFKVFLTQFGKTIVYEFCGKENIMVAFIQVFAVALQVTMTDCFSFIIDDMSIVMVGGTKMIISILNII
jgi:hypothetical protein